MSVQRHSAQHSTRQQQLPPELHSRQELPGAAAPHRWRLPLALPVSSRTQQSLQKRRRRTVTGNRKESATVATVGAIAKGGRKGGVARARISTGPTDVALVTGGPRIAGRPADVATTAEDELLRENGNAHLFRDEDNLNCSNANSLSFDY